MESKCGKSVSHVTVMGVRGGAAFISIAKAYIASTKVYVALKKARCMLSLEMKDQNDLMGCSISKRDATLLPGRSGSRWPPSQR